MDGIKKQYNNFLEEHKTANKEDATHLMMSKQKAGKFCIVDEDLKKFYSLYYKNIICNNLQENLTEVQLDAGRAMVVDIDLKQKPNTERIINDEKHLIPFIEDSLEVLNEMFDFENKDKFNIYVLRKKKITKDTKSSKDGYHLIFQFICDVIDQEIFRNKMIKKYKESGTHPWQDIPLIESGGCNTVEHIIDEQVAKGSVPWTVYGSCKENSTPYLLHKIIKVSYEADLQTFNLTIEESRNYDFETKLHLLCARNTEDLEYFNYSKTYDYEKTKFMTRTSQIQSQYDEQHINIANIGDTFCGDIDILNVSNEEELKTYIGNAIDYYNDIGGEYQQIYEYTMCLPETYWGTGSYANWINIALALINYTANFREDRNKKPWFAIWIALSAKWEGFNYAEIPSLYFDKWMTLKPNVNLKQITIATIKYLCKLHEPTKYAEINQRSQSRIIESMLKVSQKEIETGKLVSKSIDHTNIAKLLHIIYSGKFVCVDPRNKGTGLWYEYKGHCWTKAEGGLAFRKCIETVRTTIIYNKIQELFKLQTMEQDEQKNMAYKLKLEKMNFIREKMGDANVKDCILKECHTVFYNPSFMNELDTKPYLFCFTNGVYDFKTFTFRDGSPEDKISVCCGLAYSPFDAQKDAKLMAEIDDYFSKVYPDKNIKEYVWDHLASCLSGMQIDQTIHFFLGKGKNGKSQLCKFIKTYSGEYFKEISDSIYTSKSKGMGSTQAELASVKSVRFGSTSEIDDGAVMYDKFAKIISSGKEDITCRPPYLPGMMTFVSQCHQNIFTNHLLEIVSTDFAIWRRIRVIPHDSKFEDNPNPNNPFEFAKIDDLDDKFEEWKQVFVAFLIERFKKTKGKVIPCERVLEASLEYQNEQNTISEFLTERIIEKEGQKVLSSMLISEYKKWYKIMHSDVVPKTTQLKKVMEEKYGKCSKAGFWDGVKLLTQQELEDMTGEGIVEENDVA